MSGMSLGLVDIGGIQHKNRQRPLKPRAKDLNGPKWLAVITVLKLITFAASDAADKQ